MKINLACIVLLVAVTLKDVESYCNCPVNYRAVGCWKDKVYNRALPELLVYERLELENVWYNWDIYLPALACRCATAAKQHGYRFFGLQFYAECWAGRSPNADTEYKKHGEGDLCIDLTFEPCTAESDHCTGGANHNFIYEIEPAFDCPVRFERLGCYYDSTNNRALTDELLNDRSNIDWKNYDSYLRGLTCRCAMKTAEKGFNTFGLQYYGECWSGKELATNYYKHGDSPLCVNTCYQSCKHFNTFCMGVDSLNFAYRISYEKCEVPRTADGCFSEDTNNRALPERIINDVDSESSAFMGIFRVDYDSWEQYMEGLVCRCARQTKEQGYTHFGIFNEGECWGSYNEESYSMHGQSEMCYSVSGNKTTPCVSPELCAGGKTSTYVYHLSP